MNSDPFINEDDLEIIEELPCKRNGLGTLYKANYSNHVVLYRKISFSRFSNYILEEFTNEVEALRATFI